MNKSNINKFLDQSESAALGFLFLFIPAITVYVLMIRCTEGNAVISIFLALVTFGATLLKFIGFEQWVMKESQVYGDAQVYEMVFLGTSTYYGVTMFLLSILPGNPLFDVWNILPWIIVASLMNYAARLTNQKKFPRNMNSVASKERLKSMFILVMLVVAGLVHAYAVLYLVHVYIGILHPIVELIIGGVFVTTSVLLAFNRATRPFPFGGTGLT